MIDTPNGDIDLVLLKLGHEATLKDEIANRLALPMRLNGFDSAKN